ncbi:MAG: hypothetical protein WBM17_00670, partial [Anaerolineales bacterium]
MGLLNGDRPGMQKFHTLIGQLIDPPRRAGILRIPLGTNQTLFFEPPQYPVKISGVGGGTASVAQVLDQFIAVGGFLRQFEKQTRLGEVWYAVYFAVASFSGFFIAHYVTSPYMLYTSIS